MAKKPQLILKAEILQLFGEGTYRALEKSQFASFPNPTPERVSALRKTIKECFMQAVRCKDHKVLSWLTATSLLKHLSVESTVGMCAQLLTFGEKARKDDVNETENYRQVTAGIYRLLREKPAATTRRLTEDQLNLLRKQNPDKKALEAGNHNLFTLCGVFNDAKVLQQLIRKSTREGQPVSLQGLINSYRDSNGQTAAHIAVESHSQQVLEWLKNNAKGSFVYPDKTNETALSRLYKQVQRGDRFAQKFFFEMAMEKCTEGAKISKGAGSRTEPETPGSGKKPTEGTPTGPKVKAQQRLGVKDKDQTL